ncbi:TIR domain-containing protein [Synechococcus sp. 1G10]|uniref:TIR domain-containing protein n=1 Tax=Synechococcus sp. 1G10 TaxID=2025605 RepID=UPI001180A492|nr:TIR domain-containing protein [Synechococcus sp. 1G10]
MGRFAEHVFISYAHNDNIPIGSDKGWVTQFNEALQGYLTVRLGYNSVVWWDKKSLQGNSVLTPEIRQGLADSALMISILSPSYVHSEWCGKELREFCDQAEKTGGLQVDGKSRVLKVVKLPPDSLDAIPNPLRDVLNYPFYQKGEDGSESILDPAFGDEFKESFLLAVGRVAADASRLIKVIEAKPGSESSAPPELGLKPVTDQVAPIKIFLANCSSDCRQLREQLQADLLQSGYTVLPDRLLPIDSEAEYRQTVLDMLESCDMSIHLVGNSYGTVPDGPSLKSVVVLQNEIAAELSTRSSLQRVIWLPADRQPQDERQQIFIHQLEHDATAQVGADLLTGDFEQLKTEVHRLIKAKEKALKAPPEPEPEHREPTARVVYLLCTAEDLKGTIPLRKWFKRQGVEVELPPLEGGAQVLREAKIERIRRCAGLLLFYGVGGQLWYDAVTSDLRKISTYRKDLPPIPWYTYLADPDNPFKQDLVDTGDVPNLVDGRPGFDENQLNVFVQAMAAVGREP